MEFDIEGVGDDRTGRYYDFNESEPVDGITVDEADGTVTIHDNALKPILRDFVAMHRDLMLGFPPDELHRSQSDALKEGVTLLELLGDDVDDVILPEDQEALPLDL
jgi:hypothetical protein